MKELIKKILEPEIGKILSIDALVQEAYPSKCDNGVYQEYITWIQLEDKYIILVRTPNKWGEMLSLCKVSPIKTEDIWSLEDYLSDIEEILEEENLQIWEIAQEIYNDNHIFVNRTIKLGEITEDDILYMTEITKEVIRAKEVQDR
jgi:hypothetical protein